MKVIVIPARFASARYPGKPLVVLKDRTGAEKTLIQRSWEAAREVPGIDAVYVATDDARIADCAKGFGAEVLMTSSACRNGTERCAEALAQLGSGVELVVNLQGDAPLTPPWFVEALLDALAARDDVGVATPVLLCEPEMLDRFVADRARGLVGGTTAVFDSADRALYFSKEVLPYGARGDTPTEVFHHVGVYAFRAEALARYARWPEGKLEHAEGLEQLRFLENGEAIACVRVEGRGRPFWELNNPEDVQRIEAVL